MRAASRGLDSSPGGEPRHRPNRGVDVARHEAAFGAQRLRLRRHPGRTGRRVSAQRHRARRRQCHLVCSKNSATCAHLRFHNTNCTRQVSCDDYLDTYRPGSCLADRGHAGRRWLTGSPGACSRDFARSARADKRPGTAAPRTSQLRRRRRTVARGASEVQAPFPDRPGRTIASLPPARDPVMLPGCAAWASASRGKRQNGGCAVLTRPSARHVALPFVAPDEPPLLLGPPLAPLRLGQQ